jgi:hypothetical protein
MADSALDYIAEITAITIAPNRLQVKYSPADSADTTRNSVYRNIGLQSSQYNDSDIQILIKNVSRTVVGQWNADVVSQDSNPSFNDSDFVGDTYNFRYKPITQDVKPTVNPLRFKVVQYDSEGADEIRKKFNIVALDSSELTLVREQQILNKGDIELKLFNSGNWDSVQLVLGAGDPVSASWDASAGGAFDFTTDAIASYGVKTIERVSEGTYRVIPLVPFDNADYTVTTAVGAEDYAGTVSSPRQLALISRAADSFQVHCERTDDAVDEDNSYMAVIVAPFGGTDRAEISWRHQVSFSMSDSVTQTIQSVLGYNDSDMAAWMRI